LSFFHIAAIRLLIFTGARRGEILGLKWEHVDLKRRVIKLPASKTGYKEIHLNTAARDILTSLPKQSEWALPGDKTDTPIRSLRDTWKHICNMAELKDVHIHDLRHSYASVAVSLNLGLPVVGALLGHRHSRTTQRYAHLQDDPLKNAAESIGKAMAEMMSDGADVIDIHKQGGRSRRG
jgi:integrase